LGRKILLTGGTLTAGDATPTLTFAGVISGTGGLTKQGTGVLVLTGTNTFTGPVSITNGKLQVSGGSAIADTVAVSLGAAGTLELLNNETVGSISGVSGAQSSWTGGTLTAGDATPSLTYAGVISGAGGLTKQGTGHADP